MSVYIVPRRPVPPRTKLDEAIAALRVMATGPKGDRPDYVSIITCEHATALLRFIDAAKPLYEGHAIGTEEIKFLRALRSLTPAAMAELLSFETYLAARDTGGPVPPVDAEEGVR